MSGSQKFISRNRAPRVQIEYDVEVYGASKKVQLPFVMGVMSDLSGKSEVPTGNVADRKFLEIDIDNFDQRMKAMKPRAAFSVPNTLSGEGNLSVDLVFEKMSDFSPAEIARKVEPLRKLLEARTQLENLMTYMDGKAGAEALIERLVGNPDQLRALALGAGAASEQEAAFDAMKAAALEEAAAPEDNSRDILAAVASDAPEEADSKDTSADVLAGLAADAPENEAPDTSVEDALAGVARDVVEPEAKADDSGGILAGMAESSAEDAAPDTRVEDALAGLASSAIEDAPEVDASADVLAGLAADAPEDAPEEDGREDVLAGMAESGAEDLEALDESVDILADLAMAAPEETPKDTATEDALAGLAAGAVEGIVEDDGVDDVLADMADDAPEADADVDASAGILAGLAEEAVDEAPDESVNILADMALDTPEEAPVDTAIEYTLAGMAADAVEAEPVDDGIDELLSDIGESAPEDEAEDDVSGDILADVAEGAAEGAPEENTGIDDLLSEMAESAPVAAPEEGGVDGLLSDMAEVAPEDDAPDESGDILANLADGVHEIEPGDDGVEDLLADMADSAPEFETEDDESADILADIAETAVEDGPEDEGVESLLAGMADDVPEADEDDSDLEGLLGDIAETAADEVFAEDMSADILADMAEFTDEDAAPDDGLDALLGDLSADVAEDVDEADDDLDDLLAGMADDTDEVEGVEDLLADMVADAGDVGPEDDGLDDLLAGMAEDAPEDETADDDLDALLGGISEDDDEDDDLDNLLAGMADDSYDAGEGDDVEDLLADMISDTEDELPEEDDLADLLAGMAEDAPEDDAADDGLDALLGSMSDDTDDNDDLGALLADVADDDDDDLDALLSADDDDDDLSALLMDADDDLDDLLADDDSDDIGDLDGLLASGDLDDLLADSGLDDAPDDMEIDDVENTPPPKPKKPAFSPDFGSMSAAKLQYEAGARRKFRIAVLGDFSGRGNRGDLEIGDALGKRKAFKLDFDTMEDVIMRFRTKLTLPLGNDGSAIEVALNELDDLHPDELFENVELFNELNMLRRDLNSGRNFEQNVERMQAWGGEFGDFKALSKKRSKGADAPADLRLTDFQNLIGDSEPRPEASAASDLISRIIGPHIVAAADNGAEAMIAAVDAALSTAMSSVLHHPDFQSIEAAWRSIEMLGRRVEASAELEVVVYDVSVEEFAADLAAQDDVSQSGLFDMLAEKPMLDESAGPISAVVGLYTWEETPTHAELLARMARISAHMDAPFISAISTGFMGVKPEDRHPLVQKTWNALGEMPEAKYLGLASPRFMLRMPYGKKTEPLDRFDYEEFNVKEGMRSMLMANPALLVAVLLAETKARQGGDMSLGSIMSLNDMPFHFMTDQYGDQVALPCTERLLSVSGAADVVARGFMPVISVQGQNVVKLGSFQSVGGGELLGIWAGDAAKEMKSGKARMETSVGISSTAKQVGAPAKAAPTAGGEDSAGDDDDFGFDSDTDDDDDLGLDMDLDLGGDDDFDMDLGLDDDDGMDDLLAGFGDDDDDDDDDDMDADLAALLGDL